MKFTLLLLLGVASAQVYVKSYGEYPKEPWDVITNMGSASDGVQYVADAPNKGYNRVPYDDIVLFIENKDAYADQIEEDKENMAQYASDSFVDDAKASAGDAYTNVVFEKTPELVREQTHHSFV